MSYGVCGPAAIAALHGKTLEEVVNAWSEPYQGYAPVKVMKRELEKTYGWKVGMVRGGNIKKFLLPQGHDYAIARIQWEGDWKHWAEAQKNTHYVAIIRGISTNCVFSDETGWFDIPKTGEHEYLEKGHITSFIVNKNELQA